MRKENERKKSEGVKERRRKMRERRSERGSQGAREGGK